MSTKNGWDITDILCIFGVLDAGYYVCFNDFIDISVESYLMGIIYIMMIILIELNSIRSECMKT